MSWLAYPPDADYEGNDTLAVTVSNARSTGLRACGLPAAEVQCAETQVVSGGRVGGGTQEVVLHRRGIEEVARSTRVGAVPVRAFASDRFAVGANTVEAEDAVAPLGGGKGDVAVSIVAGGEWRRWCLTFTAVGGDVPEVQAAIAAGPNASLALSTSTPAQGSVGAGDDLWPRTDTIEVPVGVVPEDGVPRWKLPPSPCLVEDASIPTMGMPVRGVYTADPEAEATGVLLRVHLSVEWGTCSTRLRQRERPGVRCGHGWGVGGAATRSGAWWRLWATSPRSAVPCCT